MKPPSIPLYEAIRQMRKLSSENTPFVLAHYTHDRHRKQSHGLVVVQRALLRPAATSVEAAEANYKLFYTNQDDKTNRNCWQILIAYFNGMRVTVNSYDHHTP